MPDFLAGVRRILICRHELRRQAAISEGADLPRDFSAEEFLLLDSACAQKLRLCTDLVT